MPSIWTIAAVAFIAAVVMAILVRHFHEQEYFARYDWKKKKIEEIQAKMESASPEARPQGE